QDDIENSLIGHGGDLAVKAELCQDVLDVLGEAVQVVAEVGLDVVGVIQQPLKGEPAGVVKGFARSLAQQNIPHGERFHLLELLQDCVLGISQDAVEPADHSQRQNHFSV